MVASVGHSDLEDSMNVLQSSTMARGPSDAPQPYFSTGFTNSKRVPRQT